MQSSLVHDAKKPCLQRRQIFTGFTYYRFIISQPKPLQTTAPIQFAKIQHFTTRLQVFRPLFPPTTMPPMHFGCTSITKYTRRTTSQLHHTQPKTASRHPKGVLVYFLFKKFYRTAIKRKIESVGTPLKDWDINIYRGVLTDYNEAFIISTEKRDEILANASRITSSSVLRSLYDPIKAFLYILSSMDDNFASIISFINDKLGSFYPTRIYTESCRIRNRTANIISQIRFAASFSY